MQIVDSIRGNMHGLDAAIKNISSILNQKNVLLILIFGVIYKISLELFYTYAILPLYGYYGFDYHPDATKYIIGAIFFLVLLLIMPKNEQCLKSIFLHFQFIFIVSPMLTYYSLSNGSTMFMAFVFLAVVLQVIILRDKKTKRAQNTLYIKGVKHYFTVISCILIPCVLLVTLLYNHFEGANMFDSQYLYVVRQHLVFPPFFIYVIEWTTKAIIPFFIAYSLLKKKYWITLILLATTTVFYMVLGHKFLYLSLAVILLVYITTKYKLTIKLMYAGFALIGMLTFALYSMEAQYDMTADHSSIVLALCSFIGMRFLMLPAMLKFNYYDFFSTYPKLYFSDGTLGNVFSSTYLYADSGGRVINAASTGEPLSYIQANTGYFGDSYAQLGFFGILIMAVLLAFIIRFISNNSQNLGYVMVVAACAPYFILLNDGALFTTLLTAGLLVMVLLFLIYNEPSHKLKQEKTG